MGGLVIRLRTWWDTADRSQRTITVVGGGFLVALLIATFVFASKPKMSVVFSGLQASEQGDVIAELDKMGVPYDLDARGDILVPSEQKNMIRAKLASAGKLPVSSKFDDQDFSKIGIVNTPAVEKERLKAILEARLADSIQSMDGVASATVHLSLGEQSPFVHDQTDATASVTVAERSGGSLGPEQGRTIAMIVANSVPGLTMQNVAVVDSRMQTLYDGKNATGAGGAIQTKLSTEESESKRREQELQNKLDLAFGTGTTVATVAVELDFDKVSKQEVKSAPSDQPVSKTSVLENMNGANGAAGGIASSTANGTGAPASGTGGTSANNNYKNDQIETTYLPNTETTTTDQSAGNLKSMTIDVIADSAKVKDTTKIDDILAGYLGAHNGQPNFKATVTSVAFDTAGAKAAATAAGSAAGQERMQQIVSILPIVALIGAAFMVIKSIGKFAKNPTIMVATADGHMLPLPAGGLSVSPSALRGTDIVVSGNQSGGGGGASGSANPNSPPQEAPDVGSIENKINVPLEQIKKMSEDRPEVVAVLIKSWLLEDR